MLTVWFSSFIPCRWFPPWVCTRSWIRPGKPWRCWPTPSPATHSSPSAPDAWSSPGCARTARAGPCTGYSSHHPSDRDKKIIYIKKKRYRKRNLVILWNMFDATCSKSTIVELDDKYKRWRRTARAVEYELKMLILNSFSAFLKTTSTMVSFLLSSESKSAICRNKLVWVKNILKDLLSWQHGYLLLNLHITYLSNHIVCVTKCGNIEVENRQKVLIGARGHTSANSPTAELIWSFSAFANFEDV